MGSFYSGFGGHKSFLGHCDDGIIYSGSGNRTPIGRYENGNIYNQFKEHVGSYSGGGIYDAFGTHIASYDGGSVYNKYLNVAVGKGQVGSYDGNPAEAAALVLLFLHGNAVNDDEDRDISNPGPTPTPPIGGDSNDGCLFTLVHFLISALFFVVKAVWLFYKFLFVYWSIPALSGMTIYSIIAMVACSILDQMSLMLPVALAASCIFVVSIPYWVILFTQKKKRQMSWKKTIKYYAMWFVMGPFAYKAIVRLKNSPMEC